MSGGYTTVKSRGAFDASQSIELMLQHADIFLTKKVTVLDQWLALRPVNIIQDSKYSNPFVTDFFFKKKNLIFGKLLPVEINSRNCK